MSNTELFALLLLVLLVLALASAPFLVGVRMFRRTRNGGAWLVPILLLVLGIASIATCAIGTMLSALNLGVDGAPLAGNIGLFGVLIWNLAVIAYLSIAGSRPGIAPEKEPVPEPEHSDEDPDEASMERN
jgi:hypothetical protein